MTPWTLLESTGIRSPAGPVERCSAAWIMAVAVLLAIAAWGTLAVGQQEEAALAGTQAEALREPADPEPPGNSPPEPAPDTETDRAIERFLERVETLPAPREGRRSRHTRDDEGRIRGLRLKGVDLAPGDCATIGRMQHLVRLDLSETNVSDDDLEHLASLSRLVELNLFGTKIDGSGLDHLASLDELERLNLGDTELNDDALPRLAQLTSLRHLCLCRNALSDGGLEHLKPLKNLQTLRLGETEVTDASVSVLASFPRLRSVSLNETACTEAGLRELAEQTSLAWIDSPRETMDEFVRRMTSGDLSGASDMVTVGLLVPEQGTFNSPEITPHDVTDRDRQRGRRRFRVVFGWRRPNLRPHDGLRMEVSVDRGGVFIQEQALVKRDPGQ